MKNGWFKGEVLGIILFLEITCRPCRTATVVDITQCAYKIEKWSSFFLFFTNCFVCLMNFWLKSKVLCSGLLIRISEFVIHYSKWKVKVKFYERKLRCYDIGLFKWWYYDIGLFSWRYYNIGLFLWRYYDIGLLGE